MQSAGWSEPRRPALGQRRGRFVEWAAAALHTARRLKDHGGIPAHGNVSTNWDLSMPDSPNPEYR